MRVYYNDSDAACCRWLENLMAADLIAKGDIDNRSIVDVVPGDLQGYDRLHFFAGIGGWEYALQIADWRSDGVTWTGSCPCQPYSAAGKRKGDDDPRNLWPHFRRLIAECRPTTVFGEQVDGSAGLRWLAGVHADLEALDYLFGAVALPAASVGAPHIRSRLWWVADAQQRPAERQRRDMAGQTRGVEAEAQERKRVRDDPGDGGSAGGLGDTEPHGHNGASQPGGVPAEQGEGWYGESQRPDNTPSPWDASVLIPCADGKARRISAEPTLFPLAPRLPGDVVRLRGAGNAVTVPVAVEFIKAYIDWHEKSL